MYTEDDEDDKKRKLDDASINPEEPATKRKRGAGPSLSEIKRKKLASGDRGATPHAIRRGNFIIQTEKSKLSDATLFVLDNRDFLSQEAQGFLNFIENSDHIKLRFFETADGPNEYGETALWVRNPDGTWGNLDADQNVQWDNITSKSQFELRISLNGKHNYGDTAVNYQTVLHEFIVHGLPYYKVLQSLENHKPTPYRFKQYWDNQTESGFNNGDVQHYNYGRGRLGDYNKSVDGLAKRLQLKPDVRQPSSTRQFTFFSGDVDHPKHVSARLKEESDKDIANHKALYPSPPAGRYTSTRIR